MADGRWQTCAKGVNFFCFAFVSIFLMCFFWYQDTEEVLLFGASYYGILQLLFSFLFFFLASLKGFVRRHL